MPLNSGYDYTDTCCSPAPEPIEHYLARRYPHSSLEQWRERIARGEVLIGGQRAEPEAPVRAGQQILWRRPPWHEPEAPKFTALLYEDDALVAVVKPAGLPTMPAGGFLEQTLWHQVRQRFADASPAHRLGRFTSGIVLFGRTREALARLDAAWRAEAVTKIYRTWVTGMPAWGDCCLTHPLAQRPHPKLGKLWQFDPRGRRSRCEVRWVHQQPDRSLAEITLLTGRPHQIRIQLAAAGHPLLGDPLYTAGGRPATDGSALPGDPGYSLHAWKLEFAHPLTGSELKLEAPLPDELRR